MGVQTLNRYLTRSGIGEVIDLAQLPPGHHLLLDVSAFTFWLWDCLIAADSQLLGTDYAQMDCLVGRFVQGLAGVGVGLVGCVDGAKGSGPDPLGRRDEMARRLKQRCEANRAYLQCLSGDLSPEHFHETHGGTPPPPLLGHQVGRSLRAHAVPLRSHDGEADALLYRLLDDPMAIAVLSNDTDFVIVPNGRLITFTNLDLAGGLRAHLTAPAAPPPLSALPVRLWTAGHLARALALPVSRLPDVAFLLGNDVSRGLVQLVRQRGFRFALPNTDRPTLPADTLTFLHPYLMPAERTQAATLLQATRAMYAPSPAELPQRWASLLEDINAQGLPRFLLPLLKARLYFPSLPFDISAAPTPSLVDLLRPSRARFYAYLPTLDRVTEVCWTPAEGLCGVPVDVPREVWVVPPLPAVAQSDLPLRWRHLESIFGLPPQPAPAADPPALSLAVSGVVLRVLFALTPVSLEERHALVAAALLLATQRSKQIPGPPPALEGAQVVRCTVLANTYQQLLEYVFSLSVVLQLSRLSPKDVFHGPCFQTVYGFLVVAQDPHPCVAALGGEGILTALQEQLRIPPLPPLQSKAPTMRPGDATLVTTPPDADAAGPFCPPSPSSASASAASTGSQPAPIHPREPWDDPDEELAAAVARALRDGPRSFLELNRALAAERQRLEAWFGPDLTNFGLHPDGTLDKAFVARHRFRFALDGEGCALTTLGHAFLQRLDDEAATSNVALRSPRPSPAADEAPTPAAPPPLDPVVAIVARQLLAGPRTFNDLSSVLAGELTQAAAAMGRSCTSFGLGPKGTVRKRFVTQHEPLFQLRKGRCSLTDAGRAALAGMSAPFAPKDRPATQAFRSPPLPPAVVGGASEAPPAAPVVALPHLPVCFAGQLRCLSYDWLAVLQLVLGKLRDAPQTRKELNKTLAAHRLEICQAGPVYVKNAKWHNQKGELLDNFFKTFPWLFGDIARDADKIKLTPLAKSLARADALRCALASSSLEETEPKATAAETELPIVADRARILAAVKGHLVTYLVGDVGCGKSTQVPQFLLESGAARVVVTQPRRVAAVSLARRVAAERGEEVGQAVGYAIQGEFVLGKPLMYMTAGYLLQMLVAGTAALGEYSHIVLDEVHERTVELEMLLLLMKFQLQDSGCRLIVMSATMEVSEFSQYLRHLRSTTIQVPGRRYPLTTFFLDEVGPALTPPPSEALLFASQAALTSDTLKSRQPSKLPVSVLLKYAQSLKPLIWQFLVEYAKGGCTAIVFLPGMTDLEEMFDLARTSPQPAGFRVRLFVLHSQIPLEEQKEVFSAPSADTAHVVLATNMAESSLTLPNVNVVIDSGLTKRAVYDPKWERTALNLQFTSRASGRQRAGRAGRTMPGLVFHLYPRKIFAGMAEYDDPHHTGQSPAFLYLNGLKLAPRLNQPDAVALLAHLLHPPAPVNLHWAQVDLEAIRAITPQGGITALGELVLAVPFDLRLCLLLWYGACWGCLADAVVLACAIHVKDPFNLPFVMFQDVELTQYRASLERSSLARARFDGGLYSEPLMLRRLYVEWWCSWSRRKSLEANLKFFCSWTGTRIDRFRAFHAEVRHIAHRLLHLCAPTSTLGRQLASLAHGTNRGVAFEDDPNVLRSLLATAFCGSLMVASRRGMDLSGERPVKGAKESFPDNFDPVHSLWCRASPVQDRSEAQADSGSNSDSSVATEEEEEEEEEDEEEEEVAMEEATEEVEMHKQECHQGESLLVDGTDTSHSTPPEKVRCLVRPRRAGQRRAQVAGARRTEYPLHPDAVRALMRVVSPAGLAKCTTIRNAKAMAVQLRPREPQENGPCPTHSRGAEAPLVVDVAEEVRVALQFGEGRQTFCVPNNDPKVEGRFLWVTKLSHPARLRWNVVGSPACGTELLCVKPNVRNPVGAACAPKMRPGDCGFLACCAQVVGANAIGVTVVPCAQAHFFLLAGLSSDSKLLLGVGRDKEGELEVREFRMAKYSFPLHVPAPLLQRIAALRRSIRCSVASHEGSTVLAPSPECTNLVRQLSGLTCAVGPASCPAGETALNDPLGILSVAEVLDVLLQPKPCLAVVLEVLQLAESASLTRQRVCQELLRRLPPGALQAARLAWEALPGSGGSANPVSVDGGLTDAVFDVCHDLLLPADERLDATCGLSSTGASLLAAVTDLQLLSRPSLSSTLPEDDDDNSSSTSES